MSVEGTVNDIKTALAKEVGSVNELSDEALERCKDLLERLDECAIDMKILSSTLIGTVVSKFKPHATLGPSAKALLKKWKRLARASSNTGATPASDTAKAAATVSTLDRQTSGASTGNATKPKKTAATTEAPIPPEWEDLPSLRQNICKKLRSLLILSKKEMKKKHGLTDQAVQQITTSCSTEIEQAIEDTKGKESKQAYTEKARTLCFNLKKNAPLRSLVLLGMVESLELVKMNSDELATADKRQARDAEVNRLRDSRRLDWEQANESKINEMCGIKGELLSASLFTCGRCKSTKTTSTQKQTRSADEPMTVFVLCMNCGNRWKC